MMNSALFLLLCILSLWTVSSFIQPIRPKFSNNWSLKSSFEGSDGTETTVYVSNIAFTVTEDALKNLIEGDLNLLVSKVAIPKDKMTDRPRGFAFIDFADHAAALQGAQKLNGMEFSGRVLNSNLRKKDFVKGERTPFANQGTRPPMGGAPRVQESPEKTIYVSNINWSLTKVSIENMCEDLLGRDLVESVRFPIDRERGTSRGFCYITFKDAAAVETAISTLDGVEVLGRELRAKRFEVRDPNASPGGY